MVSAITDTTISSLLELEILGSRCHLSAICTHRIHYNLQTHAAVRLRLRCPGMLVTVTAPGFVGLSEITKGVISFFHMLDTFSNYNITVNVSVYYCWYSNIVGHCQKTAHFFW